MRQLTFTLLATLSAPLVALSAAAPARADRPSGQEPAGRSADPYPEAGPAETAPGREATPPLAPTGETPPATDEPARTVPAVPQQEPERAGRAEAAADVDLLSALHAANRAEIDLAKLALQKAESRRARSFARRLVADHTAADKKLMAYADKKGLRMELEGKGESAHKASAEQPSVEPQTAGEPGAAAAPQGERGHAGARAGAPQDVKQRLEGLSGAEFDREFVNVMIDEHERAINLVEGAVGSVSDGELKRMLQNLLPTLRSHRRMARQILERHLQA